MSGGGPRTSEVGRGHLEGPAGRSGSHSKTGAHGRTGAWFSRGAFSVGRIVQVPGDRRNTAWDVGAGESVWVPGEPVPYRSYMFDLYNWNRDRSIDDYHSTLSYSLVAY